MLPIALLVLGKVCIKLARSSKVVRQNAWLLGTCPLGQFLDQVLEICLLIGVIGFSCGLSLNTFPEVPPLKHLAKNCVSFGAEGWALTLPTQSLIPGRSACGSFILVCFLLAACIQLQSFHGCDREPMGLLSPNNPNWLECRTTWDSYSCT